MNIPKSRKGIQCGNHKAKVDGAVARWIKNRAKKEKK